MAAETKYAIFGGGCFWCMQPEFEAVKGVLRTEVGYSGGNKERPTYEEVSSGMTGHVEVIRVTYDPALVTYKDLIDVFWRNVDPTQKDGQFADRGSQYRTVIYYADDAEKKVAEASKEALGTSGKFDKPIVTAIEPAKPFFVAEDYHQQYYKKNPGHYERYKWGSGRAGFLKETWGK